MPTAPLASPYGATLVERGVALRVWAPSARQIVVRWQCAGEKESYRHPALKRTDILRRDQANRKHPPNVNELPLYLHNQNTTTQGLDGALTGAV